MKKDLFLFLAGILLALIPFTNSLKSNASTLAQVDTENETTPLQLVKDSGFATYRLFDLKGEPFGPTIEYKIDWPVGGDRNLRNKIKYDIIDMLSLRIPKDKTIDDVTLKQIMNESVKIYEEQYAQFKNKSPKYYEQEFSDIFWCDGEDDDAIVEIWDNAVVNIITTSTENIMNGTPFPKTKNKLFRIDTGQYWTPNLLPSDKNLISLLSYQLVRQGYKKSEVSQAGEALLEPDASFWTNEGLVYFYWKRWDLGLEDIDWFLYVTIPYRELLPFLSAEAKEFLPPSVLK